MSVLSHQQYQRLTANRQGLTVFYFFSKKSSDYNIFLYFC